MRIAGTFQVEKLGFKTFKSRKLGGNKMKGRFEWDYSIYFLQFVEVLDCVNGNNNLQWRGETETGFISNMCCRDSTTPSRLNEPCGMDDLNFDNSAVEVINGTCGWITKQNRHRVKGAEM